MYLAYSAMENIYSKGLFFTFLVFLAYQLENIYCTPPLGQLHAYYVLSG